MLVFYEVTARCVRMSSHHLLIIFIPGFLRHIPCTSLTSSSSPLSDSLSPSDSVLFHPGLSCQGSLNNSSGSLSELILPWFSRFSKQKKQRVPRTTSHVSLSFNIRAQDVDFPTLNFQRFLDQQTLADLLLSILFPRSPYAKGCRTHFPSPSIPKRH